MHLPLFLYFNYGQHFQHFVCELGDVDAINLYHQKYEELFLSLVLRISHRTLPSKQEDLIILSKGNSNGILALNKIIRPTDRVYIAGKQITLIKEIKWPEFLL